MANANIAKADKGVFIRDTVDRTTRIELVSVIGNDERATTRPPTIQRTSCGHPMDIQWTSEGRRNAGVAAVVPHRKNKPHERNNPMQAGVLA
ncbi:hypothetical protein GCM10010885_10470 [Alicyclobacillus cellulosilyticus]|uniref:Uncharacterized protein n=1 Tax=Alicyclobacillus cellulosilyticus TaxID=1003997 RepID=A0A917K7U2_9BACL|nr:hypothetical protein GCM10010885_10470 [Alicyclobacillus cellulosilyticus]